jgi:hypothetical protein
MSLGLFWSFFAKPKSFKKSKQLYLLLINFFRKLLLHTNLQKTVLLIKYVPKYLPELLNTLLQKKLSTHTNPFSSNSYISPHNDSIKNCVTISNIIFKKTKPYTPPEKRKKGVVKRKVLRKIIKNNNIID